MPVEEFARAVSQAQHELPEAVRLRDARRVAEMVEQLAASRHASFEHLDTAIDQARTQRGSGDFRRIVANLRSANDQHGRATDQMLHLLLEHAPIHLLDIEADNTGRVLDRVQHPRPDHKREIENTLAVIETQATTKRRAIGFKPEGELDDLDREEIARYDAAIAKLRRLGQRLHPEYAN